MLSGLARQIGFWRLSPTGTGSRRAAVRCLPAAGRCLPVVRYLLAAGLLGCSAEVGGGAVLGRDQQAFVNGADDRREYFELTEDSQRAALDQFSVALMSAAAAEAVADGQATSLPTWAQVNDLCPGEPFADQPSAAFCSGVLLDWNLVLTSGHCVNAVPLEDLRVAFGYFYTSPDQLGLGADVYGVSRVLASRRDPMSPDDAAERLDFAWLELERDVSPARRPAPVFARGPGAAEGDRVVSIGAGGGVPIKWDDGGSVQDTRPELDDYFIADTDTSQGSSGGGIFDANLVLLGSLARGAPDFTSSDAGCNVTATSLDPSQAREQFTYTHRAIEALCAEGFPSALCDAACAEPCDVSAYGGPELGKDESGCALAPARTPASPAALLSLAAAGLVLLRRRARSSTRIER